MSEVKMKVVHRGQVAPYSDTYNVWEVVTDMPKDEVVKWCKREILSNRYVPSKEEWDANKEDQDASYYFRGFWYLTEIKEGVWRFIRVLPWTD